MKRTLWFAVLAVPLWSSMAMAANTVVVETKSVALNATKEQNKMKRFAATICLAACLVFLSSAAVFGANDVTVQSLTTGVSGSANIGINVTNDVDIKQYIQPLKIVSTVGGSFITSLGVTVNAAGRFESPSPRLNDIKIYNGYQTPDGACKTTAPNVGFGTIWPDSVPGGYGIDAPNPPMPVASSPAALLIVRGKVMSALTLPPGDDNASGKPSFFINVVLNPDCPGQFEVDTTCADPANHLVFARTTGTPSAVIPTFHKGVITVGTGVNVPPVAVNDTYSTGEDTLLTVQAPGVLGNDTDCQPLTAVKVTDPLHGAVSLSSDGSFLYLPAPNYSGPDEFTYKASDGAAQGNTATVSITVNPVNDAPVARDTSWATDQNTPKAVAYLPASDPDAGQVLTYATISGPSHGGISGFNSATGAFTYTPAAGYTGPDSIKFTVCDNGAPVMCDTGRVQITVVAVSHAPVARDTSWATNQDTPKAVAYLPASDVDAGQVLTYATISGPSHGGISGFNAATGAFTYTPAAGYTGPDSIKFTVCDNGAPSMCDTGTVRITVLFVNHNPVARDSSWSTNEDTPKSVTYLPASDVDVGQTLTFAVLSGPAHGIISGLVVGTGAFTYTPTLNYNGPDSLKFTVCDNGAPSMCDTGTVRITVDPVNDAPVARDSSWATNEDVAKSVTYLPASDVDVGQTKTFAVLSGPAHGGISGLVAGTGAFTYTPDLNYNGPDSLKFTVCDNGAPSLCDTGTVRITVTAVNDAPEARDSSWSTNEDVAKSVTYLPASDVDVGQTLTFAVLSGPAHGVISGFISATGAFTYTPALNYNGPDSLKFTVCDNGAPSMCDTGTVRITVVAVNDAPVARDSSWSTSEDTPKSVTYLPASDPDAGQVLTYATLSGPSHGGISGFNSATGAFTYTPDAGYTGPDSIKFTVCDNGSPLMCDTGTVRITVNAVNHPPNALCHDVTVNAGPACTAAANIDNGSNDPDPGNVLTYAYSPAGPYPKGVTSVRLIVTDNFGLADTCQANVTVLDITLPVITCPASPYIATIPPGQTSGVVNYNVPVSDNCPGVISVLTPPSGSTFPVGDSVVWCVATDASGNKDSCSFVLRVVVANSPPVLDPIGPKSVNENILLTFPVAAHDFDGDAGITLSLAGTPAGAVLTDNGSGSGTFDWTPSCAQGGSVYSVKFIASDGDLADTETVAITVNDLPEFLVASPESVVINYQMGDPAPPPVPIDLTDPGCSGQFAWEALSSQAWLTADLDSGTTPSTVMASVDPTGLTPGAYDATLTFGSRPVAKLGIPALVVQVHLTVGAAPHDSVWVTSGAGELGDTVAVDVNFCNNHIATGISVGLKYSSFNVHPIGYSFVGSRVESLSLKSALIDEPARTICLFAAPVPPEPRIAEGCGKLATLYFVVDSIPRCPDPDSTMIDSFTVGVGCELMLTDTTLAAVYPSFAPGAIHVICPGRICGVVSDTGGNPLSSAVVQVWSSYPDGEILGSQTTGADGDFCIIGLDREGTFDLRVYRLGYCTQVVNGVNPSDFGLITVQLEPVPAIIGTPSVAFYSSANARISGVPLMLGDVITAVDRDGVVCGKTVVEAPGAYLIAVVGDDIGTVGVDEGAKTGEQITFYLNCTCPILVPTPWTDKARTEFDADFDCAQRQIQIPLCDSWTLLSFNVVPSDPSRDAVLSSISGQYQSAFTFVCPDEYLTWHADFEPNSLDAMDPFHGYWLKPSGPGADTIVLSGAPMAPNTPLNLCLGWNLISYLPDFPDTFTHALNSIDGEYVRVFGYECESQDAWKTWDANRPADLNDLGCMKPMRGYWVKTNTNTTLTYPIGGYQCNEGGPSLSKPVNLLTRVTPTPWVTDFWSAAPMSITGLRAGDHLTARTQAGVICGECLVGSKGSFLIHVYGDDPTTKDRVEGAAAGEVLRFEVNDAPADVEAGSTVWSERESTELTVAVAKSSPVPSGYALLQNYPNPFNPSTVIKFRLPVAADAKLTIYNVLGQTVRTLFSGSLSEGDHSFEWNGQNESGQVVQSGIYFYRLDTPAWSDVKKMTFLK